ncbi:class I SAM-dependent methyltransferase [bacterium AH-315-P15]|nr:class I SAM-dependent methyltransferase [bacterium AH-315-P15]
MTAPCATIESMTTDSTQKPTYSEFSDPRLVAIYDTLNPIDEYKAFYVELASKLSVSSIIDIGCGSGLLTCELVGAGHQLIGIEPSGAMLSLARKSPCGEQVRWIEGEVEKLGELTSELAIMTGHVAQFFLDDEGWQKALSSIHRALKLGGHIVFESRNPDRPPFSNWPIETSPREVVDSNAGLIKWWSTILEVDNEYVDYEIHYLFVESDEELVSTNKLRFRTREDLEQSLVDAGFSVEDVFGNWDFSRFDEQSPEMIFIAKAH